VLEPGERPGPALGALSQTVELEAAVRLYAQAGELPSLELKTLDIVKVAVASCQNEAMLESACSDPEIILWDRPPFLLELRLEQTIMLGGDCIRADHCAKCSKFLDPACVSFLAAGVRGAKVQLSESDRGDEGFLDHLVTSLNLGISTK